MTERQCIQWIRKELGPVIKLALQARPGVIYTEDWLGGMAYRETGILMHRYAGKPMLTISATSRGDYSQRPGETEKQYHGFGFWQIDIGSFPQFVKSGDWKDPLKCCIKAIDVLEGKRKYLFAEGGQFAAKNYPLDFMYRGITAAYNCGEGNVAKVIRAGADIDSRTHGKDYSKKVWEYREIYRAL